MKILKLKECGYEEAALGFSLSYNTSLERAKELLPKFAFGIPGENKFLESIYIWWDITAPRFWWQEADTYRLSTKQSESTMHTLLKRPLSQNDFENAIDTSYLDYLNFTIQECQRKNVPLVEMKNHLPEGFLQRRIWVMNYKCLQNIYIQRANHRLPQWRMFNATILLYLDHPEFIEKDFDNGNTETADKSRTKN